MNTAEGHHVRRVARLGCVVCRRVLSTVTPAEMHHVAEGSGLRSWFSVAPLCSEHHRGATGIHGLHGEFMARYKVPGLSEYGLLVWVNEDLALLDLGRLRPAIA
jgi:hypothetical protein